MKTGIKLTFLFLVFIFLLGSFVSAEESLPLEEETIVEEETTGIFELPNYDSVKKNVQPIDLEKATEKSKELGEKFYYFLQQNSVLYLLIALTIGLVFLLLGIVFRLFRSLGTIAIFIGLIGFLLINFAPDTVNTFVQWVESLRQ